MTFKLGKNIKAGQKIKTLNGWRTIKSVEAGGVMVKEGLVYFGETVYGWKSS